MKRSPFLRFLCFLTLLFLATGVLVSQYSYRTFSQQDLAEKKARPGKILRSQVCFTFHNTTGSVVNGLHARFNSEIVSLDDSGGFSSFSFGRKEKEFDAAGLTIPPDDSVTICLTVRKKSPGTHVNHWWWMIDGVISGNRQEDLPANIDRQVLTEPNGGYVREYIYKRIISRPAGLLVGIPDTADVGWIRFMKADRKYFPHTGPPRCFDFLATGLSGQKFFVGERKNLHVKRHNNHLLGELHALKLAIIANDAGAAEPIDTLSTPLGDLLYNDPSAPSDPFNGLTVREIVQQADSALTFCSRTTAQAYIDLDNAVGRINSAFNGAYVARSVNPLILAGTVDLALVPFLHSNPSVLPRIRPVQSPGTGPELPDGFALQQNYPNPFNPATVIGFSLPVDGYVTLKVYNMLGQEVVTLLDNEFFEEGDDEVEFDASSLPSGMYVYRIAVSAPGMTSMSASKSLLLVK